MAAPKPSPPSRQWPLGVEEAAVGRLAAAFEQVSGVPPAGETWIGDDAAVLRTTAGVLVLAVDTAVAGVHADLSVTGLDDLGFKGLTTSVSDLAAMGARPSHALVSLCVPSSATGADLEALEEGLADASRRWACPVVGGDLTTAAQVVVSVTVLGRVDGGPSPLLRSGAGPGDQLYVTGPLGASAAGLRLLRQWRAAGVSPPVVGGASPAEAAAVLAHRRPPARVAEGQVARHAGATAAIDVSDGLGLDLHRLASASGVGFDLHEVPVAAGATLAEALSGGDDYELVLATPEPDRLCRAFREAGLPEPVHIGQCLADPGARRLSGEPLEPSGWQHPVGG